jgi:hypothetical protein
VSWGYGAFLLVPTLPLVISAIWLLTFLVPGRYKFVSVNPQLGQISLFGRDFAAIALIFSQAWIWIIIVTLLVAVFGSEVTRGPNVSQPDLVFLLAAIGGVTLDVVITSNADNHRYFSGPMYFVSALAILRLASVLDGSLNEEKQTKSRWLFGLLPFLAGVVWFKLEGVQGFWNTVGELTGTRSRLELELMKFVTNDSRFAAIVIALGLILVLAIFEGIMPALRDIFIPLMIVLTVLSFVQLFNESISSFKQAVSESEIVDSIGSIEEVEVGRWLRDNTTTSDLIATNHLFGDEGGGVDNMALAVWSQREFFVLGPSLGSKIEEHRIAAMIVSRSFADDPSAATCRRISQVGVKWFVVDRRLTETRDWSVCAKPKYSNSHFAILKVTSVGIED